MKRREFLGTLAGAGAALAAAPGMVLAEAGHGAMLSKESAIKHKSVEDIPVILEVAVIGSTS